jgi:hypothetical protein
MKESSMLTTYLKTPRTLEHYRSGLAGPNLDAFAGWLEAQRYQSRRILHLLRGAHRFSRCAHHVAEALAPHLTDVTVDGLLIRNTKLKKRRVLPLHATTRAALDRYLVQRRRVAGTQEGKVATCKLGDLVLKRPDGAFLPACYLKSEFVHHGRHRAFDGYHGRLLLDNLRADVTLEQAGLCAVG